VLAVTLLALGIALEFGAPEEWNTLAWAGAFIRVGSILGILWFALPELGTGKSRERAAGWSWRLWPGCSFLLCGRDTSCWLPRS
jgi:hypothetical protein